MQIALWFLVPAAVIAGFAATYFAAQAIHAAKWISLPDSVNRIGCIDGIRGYLAIAVAVSHFDQWGIRVGGTTDWRAYSPPLLDSIGTSAVIIFFMVTGALFYPRLIDEKKRINWLSFAVSRVFRLTPVYWLMAFLVVAIVLWRHHGAIGDAKAFGIGLLDWFMFYDMPDLAGESLTHNIVSSAPWSLLYEWKFYAFLPAVYVALLVMRAFRVDAIFVLAAVLIVGAIIDATSGPITLLFLQGREPRLAFPFVFGMLAIEATRRKVIADFLRSRIAAVIGLIALGLELVSFGDAFGMAQYALLAVFFFPIVAGNDYFSLLSRPASLALGEVSYSIYLLHGIVLSVFMTEGLAALKWSAGPSLWALFPVLAVTIVLLSTITCLVVERPGIALGQRVARTLGALHGGLSAKAATAAAAVIATLVFAEFVPYVLKSDRVLAGGPYSAIRYGELLSGTQWLMMFGTAWFASCLAFCLFRIEQTLPERTILSAIALWATFCFATPDALLLACPAIVTTTVWATMRRPAPIHATIPVLAVVAGLLGLLMVIDSRSFLAGFATAAALATYFTLRGDRRSAAIAIFGSVLAATVWWCMAGQPLRGLPGYMADMIASIHHDFGMIPVRAHYLEIIGSSFAVAGVVVAVKAYRAIDSKSCLLLAAGVAIVAATAIASVPVIGRSELTALVVMTGIVGCHFVSRPVVMGFVWSLAIGLYFSGILEKSPMPLPLLQTISDRYTSAYDKLAAINGVQTGTPKGYTNAEPTTCSGSIDIVSGAYPQLYVQGWLAVSPPRGIMPDKTFIFVRRVSDEHGRLWPAVRMQRPDLTTEFGTGRKQPGMSDAGFQRTIFASRGDYVIGLAEGYHGELKHCTNLERTFTLR